MSLSSYAPLMAPVTSWHDRRISAGQDWEEEINSHLNTSQIILLLISQDFKIDVNFVDAYVAKGRALLDLEDPTSYKEALDALERAIEFKPDLYQAWHHKGRVLYRLGDFAKAKRLGYT